MFPTYCNLKKIPVKLTFSHLEQVSPASSGRIAHFCEVAPGSDQWLLKA